MKRKGNAATSKRVYKLFTSRYVAAVHDRCRLPYVAVFCDALATSRRYRVRFDVHLEPGTYLLWERHEPTLLAEFLDDLRNRWLEPGDVFGPSPHPRCVDLVDEGTVRWEPEGGVQLALL